jgi:aspartate/methionine/tyrosine aminotransferase
LGDVRLNHRTVEQVDSPIGTTYALLGGRERTGLLDLAQAAPRYPPAPEVVEHIAATARRSDGSGYVEITGLPRLREAFAAEVRAAYRGQVDADQVVVTAGCNQAFCLVASALAGPGDEVVLVLPYYFNHDMWLRMNGVTPVYLRAGPGPVPTAAQTERVITARTRAIVLVSPGNPSGVTADPSAIVDLARVAARHDIALILDETYRTFRDTDEPAHPLFADPDWPHTLVSLHSFSKEFAIPGYRVGALVGSADLNREVAKLLDCVAICAPRIGQEAAWAGLTTARDWRRDRALDVAHRRRWFSEAMESRPGGFELESVGGFFAWVRHPFVGRRTEDLVRDLVARCDALVMPGTAFMPEDHRMLRVSVGNADRDTLLDFADRLRRFAGCHIRDRGGALPM